MLKDRHLKKKIKTKLIQLKSFVENKNKKMTHNIKIENSLQAWEHKSYGQWNQQGNSKVHNADHKV